MAFAGARYGVGKSGIATIVPTPSNFPIMHDPVVFAQMTLYKFTRYIAHHGIAALCKSDTRLTFHVIFSNGCCSTFARMLHFTIA